MAEIKVWKEYDSSAPKFPDDFEVAKKAVLQVTDIKNNRNKYYAIELHSAKNKFRVFTHYGRTDDLDSNPNAGVKEIRYCSTAQEAENLFNKIYKEKTSAAKGYKELNLASAKIGSKKAIGTSSGEIDDKTLKKLSQKNTATVVSAPKITISKEIQELTKYLYSEATNALTNTVNASITANGIETPLGVLTIGQIDKGQDILDQLASSFSKKKKSQDNLTKLSGDFYTVIPHKFGRTREAANLAIIDTAAKINEKQDTLQLMRDMLNVNGASNVLVNPEIEKKYSALGCKIDYLATNSAEFKKIKDFVIKSRVDKYYSVKIKNIYTLHREIENKEFTKDIGNQQLLFHGSNIRNWIGILSRGLLMPKTVVSLGGYRTDEGWLGHGIYFGDAICTSLNYAGEGDRGTSLIALTTVALGNVKKYYKITHGIKAPPTGYDSCHGVRDNGKTDSDFDDDEYVIYNQKQHKLQYLVECSY